MAITRVAWVMAQPPQRIALAGGNTSEATLLASALCGAGAGCLGGHQARGGGGTAGSLPPVHAFVPHPRPSWLSAPQGSPRRPACADAVALPGAKGSICRVGAQACQEGCAEASLHSMPAAAAAAACAGRICCWTSSPASRAAVGAAARRRRGRSSGGRGLAAAVRAAARAAGCRGVRRASQLLLLASQLQPALGAEGSSIGAPGCGVSVQQVGADEHGGACTQAELAGLRLRAEVAKRETGALRGACQLGRRPNHHAGACTCAATRRGDAIWPKCSIRACTHPSAGKSRPGGCPRLSSVPPGGREATACGAANQRGGRVSDDPPRFPGSARRRRVRRFQACRPGAQRGRPGMSTGGSSPHLIASRTTASR